MSRLIDAHTHIGTDLMFYLTGSYPYALDWPTLVRFGEAAGVGQFVVFPMVTNLSLNIAAMREQKITTEGALEKVPYAVENRRMMNEIHQFPEWIDRAIPLWMIDPSREPAAQVEALRALSGEYRCDGLKIQATIIRSFVRDLLGPGECLLDYAEEKGLPILIHTSVHPEDPWSAVDDILAVVEARPGLRFNLAHSCRFSRRALNRVAELPNAWSDCSAHRIHCQLAVDDHPAVAPVEDRVPSDYRDPDQVLADLAERYPDKLLWGSDAPFDSYVEGSMALRSSYALEAETLHSLPEPIRQTIADKNIRQFLYGPNV